MKLVLSLLMLVMNLLMLLYFYDYSFGQDHFNLSNTSGLSYDHSVGTGSDMIFISWTDTGNIHNNPIVANANNSNTHNINNNSVTGQSDIYFRKIVNGTPDNKIVNVSNSPGESGLSLIKVNNKTINLVWEDNSFGNYEIMYSFSVDRGYSFSKSVNISESSSSSRFADFIQYDNTMYVVWSEERNTTVSTTDSDTRTIQSDIYFRKIVNGTPDDKIVNVSNSPGDSLYPKVIVDSKGNVYAIWQEGEAGHDDPIYNIVYRNLTDFSDIITLSQGEPTEHMPDEHLSEHMPDEHYLHLQPSTFKTANQTFALWTGEPGSITGHMDILMRPLDNSSDIINVSTSDGISRLPYAISNYNNILLVWSDTGNNTAGQFDIYFRKIVNGTPDNKIVNVSNSPGDSTHGKIIADLNNHTYNVAWSDTGNNTAGQFDIYFRKIVNGTPDDKIVNVSNSPGDSLYPSILIVDDKEYFFWQENINSTTSDIAYKQIN